MSSAKKIKAALAAINNGNARKTRRRGSMIPPSSKDLTIIRVSFTGNTPLLRCSFNNSTREIIFSSLGTKTSFKCRLRGVKGKRKEILKTNLKIMPIIIISSSSKGYKSLKTNKLSSIIIKK